MARVHTRRLFFWDVSIRNSLRSNKNWMHVPGGRRDDTYLWPRLVQKIAEGKTSYELSWKVKVMKEKKRKSMCSMCDTCMYHMVYAYSTRIDYTLWKHTLHVQHSSINIVVIRNRKICPGWISYLRIGTFYTNFSITIAEFLKFR